MNKLKAIAGWLMTILLYAVVIAGLARLLAIILGLS